jgi:uncharacterized membrane protein
MAHRSKSHHLIVVTFEDDNDAYAALTQLEELDSQHDLEIEEAAVVLRGEDGRVIAKQRRESMFLQTARGGGLIGLLIGIIGGPLGILIGGGWGLLVGTLVDIHDLHQAESALGAISSSVSVGHTALMAVVLEESPEAIDAAMTRLGGTVLRRSASDVEAEIAAAEKAQRKAKREADTDLLGGRRESNKEAVHAKVEELKTRLHHGEKAASHSA